MSNATTAGFVHLHVHTEFSPLDGMTNIEEACAKVASEGQVAFAVTDHGDLGGAWRLNRAAKANGIKPLIGVEAYLAVMADWRDEPDRGVRESVQVERDDVSAADDDEGSAASVTKTKNYEHLTIFATNAIGWRNLASIMDIAEETGYWNKPRIDYKLLKEYSEGLIVLTGCLGGPVLGPMSRGAVEQARMNLDRIIDAVGHDKVFVEIMEHGIEAESACIPDVVALAAEYQLPIVATNDSHYTNDEEFEAHAAWLAVSSGKALSDPKRFQFHGRGYHVRTEEEMRALRPEPWWQVACDNTVAIAGLFEEDILPEARIRLPRFPLPEGFATDMAFAKHLCRVGLAKRPHLGTKIEGVVKERLLMELKIIDDQGFLPYFFMVEDLIRWAREDGNLPGWPTIEGGILVGPGRGSAAGSLFSYLLEIVDIDPLENNLLFERFMEPGRADMPDIDIDFELRYVERVRAYLAYKWGVEAVARIGTHGVARTKAAIKDAARVLELPAIGARLTKVVPSGAAGGVFSFAELDDTDNGASEKFRDELSKTGDDGARVVELARKMEGTLKGQGIHACGILISTEPLRGLVPLRRDRSKKGGEALRLITAWDAPDVGDLPGMGLLKLDVLSIRNLDIVSTAIANIEATTGEVIDPRRIPHPNTKGDPRVAAAWNIFKTGRTAGIFQMDSSGMQNVSRSVSPDCLTDLSAIIALFRPGPLAAQMDQLYAQRKAGLLPVSYDQFTNDPAEQAALATVLGETYGVWVFQEQLMRLGAVVAGFDAKKRSKLRKAVGKKNKKLMDEVSAMFLEGATQEFRDDAGNVTSIVFTRETAMRIIEAMKGSAAYLFNASHSAAYAQLAYITAYLKANWPAEYGAAILAVTDADDKRLSAIEALSGEGISILPPDVNESQKVTRPAGDMQVRLGLSEIKGVGALGELVVEVRDRVALPYSTLADLVHKLTDGNMTQKVSIASIEGLIESGACDAFGPRLGQIMVARAVKDRPDITIPDAEWSILELATRQRKLLGLSLGVHPVREYRQDIQAFSRPGASYVDNVGEKPVSIRRVPDSDGAPVFVAGLLGAWSESAYSKGRRANITLENSGIRISGVMWDTNLKKVEVTPEVGSIVALAGNVTMREQEIEDEEGNVIETLITKEMMVRQVFPIPVNDQPTGSFIDALTASAAAQTGDLPEVPALDLLKLPPKPRKGTSLPPKVRRPGEKSSDEPAPAPAEPEPELTAPPVAPPLPTAPVTIDQTPEDPYDAPTDLTSSAPRQELVTPFDSAPDDPWAAADQVAELPVEAPVTPDVTPPATEELDEAAQDDAAIAALLGTAAEPVDRGPAFGSSPVPVEAGPKPVSWTPASSFMGGLRLS
ncbi:DNA polymerase III subunit alpha [Frigoribacterium sp. SL97]|uniref:DNA polymerase III subunit alpha n=1 Tax=Frigoribacterium sp. SL97 TaxID=2994664 RepID=UPI00226DE6E6|nr:DNA polymerase III subunit alpha [Frigoribacterium sp. SL97]WAC50352.1 DNA polymerase III subunit alpha [Frigoribacterium sp. SL97]